MAWISGQTLEDLGRLSKLLSELDRIRSDQAKLGEVVLLLSDRLRTVETKMDAAGEIQSAREDALKAQVETIALLQVQQAVNAVQGAFHQRLENVRLDLDRLARPGGQPQIGD